MRFLWECALTFFDYCEHKPLPEESYVEHAKPAEPGPEFWLTLVLVTIVTFLLMNWWGWPKP
jgi:hypothetical protein